jgi:hypothetical protein
MDRLEQDWSKSDWLEDELKQALARQDPSPDFASRVVAAAARPAVVPLRPAVLLPRWLPVAAAVLVILGGGAAYRQHQGMVAKERVMLAMRITAGQLNHIQTHVKETRQ